MMKLFACAAIALAIPAAAQAQSMAERQASIEKNVAGVGELEATYAACVKDETVRMGKGNSEPSNNVVQAAFAKCVNIESEYRQSADANAVLSGNIMDLGTAADREFAKLQRKVQPAAMAALLDARATQ